MRRGKKNLLDVIAMDSEVGIIKLGEKLNDMISDDELAVFDRIFDIAIGRCTYYTHLVLIGQMKA